MYANFFSIYVCTRRPVAKFNSVAYTFDFTNYFHTEHFRCASVFLLERLYLFVCFSMPSDTHDFSIFSFCSFDPFIFNVVVFSFEVVICKFLVFAYMT